MVVNINIFFLIKKCLNIVHVPFRDMKPYKDIVRVYMADIII